MTGWAQAREQAERLQADYPSWQVRPVHRRDGTGVEALRDRDGLCSVTGSVAEVQAVLAEAGEHPQ